MSPFAASSTFSSRWAIARILRAGITSVGIALGIFAAQPASAADFRLSFEHAEKIRTATIYEPRRIKRVPRATIIVLHGTENGNRIRRRLGLDALAATAGYAVIYPDALNGHWNNGLESVPNAPDDVAFLHSLINRLAAAGITDPRRVYMIGASEGGIMALRYSCAAAGTLSGTISLLGGMPASEASCKLAKPLPFLAINGTADELVPYTGGLTNLKNRKGSILSTEQTVGIFAAAANCTGTRSQTTFPDRDKEDKSTAILETYSACQVPVELIRVEGGGHALPGKRANAFGPSGAVGVTNRDIESNKIIWDFIRRLSH